VSTWPLPPAFEVNREDARDRFLRVVVKEAVTTLAPDTRPAWGRMTAQQMVEHLTWMYDVSVGAAQVPCFVGEEQQKRIRAFLYDEHPSPRNLTNPALAGGLPPLKSPDLAAALAALDLARRRFVDRDESARRVAFTHPVFGPLVREEWSRFHCKHVFHHLLQFGLINT
jgi:DinB family protein